ncbi:MAG: ABC transporter substrate-binding protein, partial [Anaerolineae bacterium]|nr:ABC transporter substrate-binding protein [Anaerolineae bacterium]
MKSLYTVLLIIILAAALTGCGATSEPAVPAEEPPAEEVAAEATEEVEAEPTVEEEAEAEEPAAETGSSAEGLTCDEPIQVGLISDLTGALSIYGTMTERSFLLGMEYATGVAPDAENTFDLGGCQLQVIVGDDQSDPENTATVAREMVEVNGVDILVGTVSSGATATLQEVARENNIVHIAAPAAANDITGVNFDEHTFRTSRNNYQDAVNLCEYLTT